MTTPRDFAQKMAEKSDEELLAMFASLDDWTAEALDAAKAELRKRGLDLPGERHPPEPKRPENHPETDDSPDSYEFFGTYPNDDARLLIDAFVGEDIRFTMDVDKIGVANLSPGQAGKGGTFGAGVGIAIGVYIDDYERAMEIRQRVFKIML